MRRFILIALFLISCTASAEIKVPLIGLGWQITFEGPPLKKSSLDYPKGSIQFRANAGRFNVSLFVEPPPDAAKGSSHTDCRDFYWPQAKRNPAIVVDSIKQTKLQNCEVVEYRAKGEFQGQPYIQDSLHCYIIHEGKWVDFHVSVVQPTEEDTKSLRKVATSLRYGPIQVSKGLPETINIPELGSLLLTPPIGWVTGNLLTDDTRLDSKLHTLSIFSPTDPNSNCQITFMAAPQPPGDRDALHQAVKKSTDSIVSTSVEGKSVIRDLKLKQGIGAVASFTDSSLVGKPNEPGNAKAIASGMIVLKPKVLTVVSMFMDDASGPDASKMLQALETLSLE